ncbi:cerebellin-1-like [Pecten maximus]|uniref:cerebellin-1-like n=1 Tax=Pecten maximus TaxID=6579 RepID=UPI0014582891|nr:cerebellin-1-like [Pecten maximus]
MSSTNTMQLVCIFAVSVLVTCDNTKGSLSSLQQQVQTLQAAFQRQNEHFERRIQELAAENQELKDQCKLQPRIQQKRVSGLGEANNVGFSASLSTSTALGDHQIVVFDTILTNDGNGYDSKSGHFTAPLPGLYAFSVTAMCSGSEAELHVAIIKDGQRIASVFANGNHYDNGSKLVVVQLQAGQMVWVEHFADQSGNKIFGTSYSSFSGFLINAY